MHDPHTFEEAFILTSYQKVFKIVFCPQTSRILDILSGTLRVWKKKVFVDLIAIFRIF